MEELDFEPVPDDSEKQEKYHYPEVMNELRPAIVSLVKQLKEAIERGDYQTIISDESRGRIPTLVLRKTMSNGLVI